MAKKLSKYNQKRDFNKTNEPEGVGKKAGKKLHFVVQHHMARREHYDLRLELDGVMLSWAVPKGPSYLPSDKRLAVHVEDHPLEYRHFEGTIPKGEYGGGTVMIWDEGYYEPYADMEVGLRKGSLKFTLKGSRLKGRWALVRLKAKDDDDKTGYADDEEKEKSNWLLIKDRDEYAKDSAGIEKYTTSIKTGRTMAEIETGAKPKKNLKNQKNNSNNAPNPFKSTSIQLAKLVSGIPSGEGWLYEFKYDGYRIISYVENDNAKLLTRNGHDYADRFQSVTDSLITFSERRSMVLDGEMAVIDKSGRTDFQALQNYLKNPDGKSLTYIVFDLLALDGVDLRALPLIERKEKLETLLEDAPENIHYSRHVAGNGEESLAAATKHNMEGIIGKRADSIYAGLRSNDWVKIKCDWRQEFVIGGYTISNKSIRGLSALLLGYYEDDNLIYAGRAGTGFTEKSAKEILVKFNSLKRKTTPFETAPKKRTDESIIWLRPTMVAEIKFAEWTSENQLRQASFKGLRIDKEAKEVRKEVPTTAKAESKAEPKAKVEPKAKTNSKAKTESKTKTESKDVPINKNNKSSIMAKNDTTVIINGIKISNPNKAIFGTEITKLDVIRYYEQVAEMMLPYIKERILSIVRCPNGVECGTCFFKKHPEPGRQGIFNIAVPSEKGKERDDYFYIKDIVGLISEAQMRTLEFHIWGSKVPRFENPDMIVFDLDPDEGMDLKAVRQGVRDLRLILDDLSLNSYLKTSGGKGYHVVVPLKPTASWEKVKDFAKSVVQLMENKWPSRYTSNSRKIKRTGKIYVDWQRNGRGATSIAPYSLRARAGAKVSMPIAWEELSKVTPDGVDMKKALKWIKTKEDPWHDFFQNNQQLK